MNPTVTGTREPESIGGGRGSKARRMFVAALLPLVIVGNSLILLLVPWQADLQYALPGFPDPPPGLSPGERSGLARDGIVSIWPIGPGDRLLGEARLDSGAPAFGPDEIAHMADVRRVVTAALVVWLLAYIALVTLLRGRDPAESTRSLKIGAWSTVAAFALVGLGSALSFDAFFTSFHEVLFEDGTWTFPLDSTLIGLYPERFWVTATAGLVLLSMIQALMIIWWSGRSRMAR